MSSSTSNNGQCANIPAENADWRKQVDEVQKILSRNAASLQVSLRPGDIQSMKDATEKGPIIFAKLQELEKLQRSRLDDINRCHDEWQGAVSDRTRELTNLEQGVIQQQQKLSLLRQKTAQQQGEANKVGGELGSISNQRMDALEKLATLKETLERHEQHVRQEDIRLDDRSAHLDSCQQELQSQQAVLNGDHETLNRDQQNLADRQEEQRKVVEANNKKSARITKRLDVLVEYQDQKHKEVAGLLSRIEDLKRENDGFTDARRALEERCAALQQEATVAKEHVVGLEGTIQSQNKELSTLHTVESEKTSVSNGLSHLASVILPQKEAKLTSLEAELVQVKNDTRASDEKMTGRINELDAEKSSLQDQYLEQSSQLSQLSSAHDLLRVTADQSSSEASSAKTKLAVAEATINSLNSEMTRFRKRHAELQAEANGMRPCKINFDAAIRLQNASNAKIGDLEKERENIRQERDSSDQQLETLRDKLSRSREEARRNTDLHDQALKRETQTSDMNKRRYEAAEKERDESTEENITLTAQRDELIAAKCSLTVRCNEFKEHLASLSEEHHVLQDVNANLQQEKRDVSNILAETEDKAKRLTRQLESCHCSDRRSSCKRRHDQLNSGEEEPLSADEHDRIARRLGKAPELRDNLNAAGRSCLVSARTSVSPEL